MRGVVGGEEDFNLRGVFAVYDSKASFFFAPYIAPSKAVAERMFATAISAPNSELAKFPEDYTLFHLGFYRETSGELIPLEAPESVIRAQVSLERMKKNAES